MSNNEKKCINVMHHTHWDREWYESFEQFRYKLRNGIRYVEELIENGTIKCFFVDGQTIVIDDYKEIVSEDEFSKLKKLIKDGKIEIGPWYILADEFLVSGESLVKNLELGIEISKELGSKYDIGYLPDTFGHISQMPQVLNGYGIKNAIIWRGAVSQDFENEWVGSDGSSVLTFVLPLFSGYFQTYMKSDDFKDKLTEYINENTPYCKNGQILCMNGADHTYTSSNIKERLEEFKNENPNLQIEEVLMSDFVKKFENYSPKTKILQEQRNEKKIFTLPGVFSTRMYLKKANSECEDNMINKLEFLNAWTNGETRSDEFIKYLWKLLVQNHAHDSICGCSIDEVHEEMEVRFKKILAGIKEFENSTLEEVYPYDYMKTDFINNKLHLINSIPFKDKYVVETEVVVPKAADKGNIKLEYKGQNIDFELIQKTEEEILFRNIKVEPYYDIVKIYKVRFLMEFDGIESKTLDIILEESIEDLAQVKNDNFIENEFYKIEVNENSLNIVDKANNKEYKEQHIIVSSLDAGDTYTYSPPKNDKFTKATVKSIEPCQINSLSQKIIINYSLEVPKELNFDRSGASEETVNIDICTEITLVKGINKILFNTKINNNAKDHKLRIGFNLIECNEHYSDTAFDLVKRGVLRNQILDVEPNKELECNQHPTLSTIMANDFQIVHRGMQEYEVTEYENSDYCFVTALRCIGDLSRRDLRTRGGGAGPGYKTEGAQCIGEHSYQYALIVGKEKFNINNKNIVRNSIIWKQSLKNIEDRKIVSINNSEIGYSSLVRKKDGSTYMRLFNSSNEDKEFILKDYVGSKACDKVKLDGDVLEPLSIINNEVNIKIKAKEICTIKFSK